MSDTMTTVPAHMYRTGSWDSPGFTHYLRVGDPYAVSIWEEAHAEHAERFPTVRPRSEEPFTYIWSADLAWDLALAERDVRNLRAEVGRLSATVTALRTEQIDGSDFRLQEFWRKAGDLADEAGHCQVYDELAEALGGEPRRQEYSVTVTYRFTVDLTRAEADDFDLNDYDPTDHDFDPDVRVERN